MRRSDSMSDRRGRIGRRGDSRRRTYSRSRSRERSEHHVRSRMEHHHRPSEPRMIEREEQPKQSNSSTLSLIAQRSAALLQSHQKKNGNHQQRSEMSPRKMTAVRGREDSPMSRRIKDKSRRPKFQFLSKEQRQNIALERLKQQRAEESAKRAQMRGVSSLSSSRNNTSTMSNAHSQRRRPSDTNHHRMREEFRSAHSEASSSDRRRSDYRSRGSDRMMRYTGDTSHDRQSRDDHSGHHSSNHTMNGMSLAEAMKNASESEKKAKELAMIKDQYLGGRREKKKVVPPSQKFRFNFDWDAADDTSEALNSFYMNRAPRSVNYGRGFVAGIDRDWQKQQRIERMNLKNRGMMEPKKREDILKQSGIEDEGMAMALRQRHYRREQRDKERRMKQESEARSWREKKLSEMTERDWRFLKEEFAISTKFGGRLPNPLRFWDESSLSEPLLRAINEVAKYKEPSAVQRMAIPIGLQNRDCVGIAETGSGKTAAFVLPMLEYVLREKEEEQQQQQQQHGRHHRRRTSVAEDGPYALVLAPARELARQIEAETKKFARFISNVRIVCIIGGISMDEQSALLREGADVIIATPGRLADSLENRYVALNQCKYVVLDEADRMIDLGFEDTLQKILDEMPVSNLRPIDEDPTDDDDDENHTNTAVYRQTFMFSATMPAAVERLSKEYLRNPVFIRIGDSGERAAQRVQQRVIFLRSEAEKRKQLCRLLLEMRPPIMVFVKTRAMADSLVKFLRTQTVSLSFAALHAGKSQESRESALQRFRDQSVDCLVCTNLAGRGIDVRGVQHVVNHDMPATIEDYTHRIGRTGRAGESGTATSLVTEDDSDIFFDLKRMLLASNANVPRELANHEASQRDPRLVEKVQASQKGLRK